MGKQVRYTTVEERNWGRDDTYKIIRLQVFNFKVGEELKVTLEKAKVTRSE